MNESSTLPTFGAQSPPAAEMTVPSSSTGLDIWVTFQPVADPSQFEKLGRLLFRIIEESTGTATLPIST